MDPFLSVLLLSLVIIVVLYVVNTYMPDPLKLVFNIVIVLFYVLAVFDRLGYLHYHSW